MKKPARSKNTIVSLNDSFTSSLQVACRIRKLRELLKEQKIVRLLEVHNGLTGLIAEKTKIYKNNKAIEFNGMWESSLTDSLSKGKPDISVVDVTSRILTLHEILDVTTKPMIVDINNGGLIEHLGFTVRTLERLGVSAIVMEDKIGAKRNSLFGTSVLQEQDSIKNFSKKIQFGKKNQSSSDFMIIARIESLILKKQVKDALRRARAYIQAGADGILIHSREKTPKEIFLFCEGYKKITKNIPLVVVPTTYNMVSERELVKAGVKMVIYANHLLRSAYPAMEKTAEMILKNERSLETDTMCMSISDILNLIPFSEPS